ncbi:MAG: DUF1801 domain-containing protein [Rhodothermales bacterium]|nr:DUF1801 domain-containing protein [Rhodothermales bacterium]MBO6780001.1 DUF1801 domain-containing protein [Rhodothermales bacterium]
MQIPAADVNEYFQNLPPDRQDAMMRLRAVIVENLPEGFQEQLQYKMPGWVVPHSLYPDGYHCNPDEPLPFASIASQKNFVALYHMGIYADPELLEWFRGEYAKRVPTKLDMGKSCIRFKKLDQIPYDLIGELMARITPRDWVARYEANVKR